MATRTIKASVSDNHNVTSSAPFYVLYRSRTAGIYSWLQLDAAKYRTGNASYPETQPGYETETAALEAIKGHKGGNYTYDYLIVRALSLVAVRPVVETVVTEVKF